MKKLLVLALTAVMVLALSTVAFAGTISLDYLSGTWDVNATNGDANGYLISIDAPFTHWKIGVDYFSGTWQDITPGVDYDYTATELKFGYLVSSSDSLNFYVNLGYMSINYDLADATAYLIGADLNFLISDASTFDIGLAVSISGEEDGGPDISSAISAKLKYTYFFNDSVGMGIGYRYIKYTLDTAGDPYVLNAGYTLGVSFRF